MTTDLIREEVYDAPGKHALPSTFKELQALVQRVHDKVPAQFLDTVTLNFDTYADGSGATLKINYNRPMTAKEREQQAIDDARRNTIEEEYELKQLARLQAKYPGVGK